MAGACRFSAEIPCPGGTPCLSVCIAEGSAAGEIGQGAPSARAPTGAQVPAAAALLDSQLAGFLRSKGVNPDGMSAGQARMIAATLTG